MTIRHYALVEDYFDEAKRLRVFLCEDCGTLIDNDHIEKHEQWHVSLSRRIAAAHDAAYAAARGYGGLA